MGIERRGHKMLKRVFSYNKFFSTLFLMSLFATFIIMYYGLNLNRQFIQVSKTRRESVYGFGRKYIGTFAEDIVCTSDIEDARFKEGNIIFRCDGPVGEGVINTNAIDVLWLQNEELLEPIRYEKYYLDKSINEYGCPKCIIGDAWMNEVYIIDGIKYIKVFQIESIVIGQFETNNFQGEDERCLVFREGFSKEELDKIIFSTGGTCIIYESNTSDDAENVTKWVNSLMPQEQYNEKEMSQNIWASSDGYAFSVLMGLYQKVYWVMIVFCYLNCMFLVCFWGDEHMYEFMLKRTMGYSKQKLFQDIILQLYLYELIALCAAMVVMFVCELFRKDVSIWVDNIKYGFLQMAFIFFILGTALSMFPLIATMKMKPAEVLKNVD